MISIVIHRGTHQIGGVAVEIHTDKTRILIDMGSELGLEEGFVSAPLDIRGVTDRVGTCDAVFFSHHHGDHVGQMDRIREDIPIYMGHFGKLVLQKIAEYTGSKNKSALDRIRTFAPGEKIVVGDITITPYLVDHSACDSYMFLIEGGGKRILHTGDFRTHGFRGRVLHDVVTGLIGKVDILLTEGTMFSREQGRRITEFTLRLIAREVIADYKYVFVLASSTNLERLCALSKVTPRDRFFLVDAYQKDMLDLFEREKGKYSDLYRDIRKTVFKEEFLPLYLEKGCVMPVRNTEYFRKIIRHFDPRQSIILYSMWDGYRTQKGSTIPDFLSLAGSWETWHASGHAYPEDIAKLIEDCDPGIVIPFHTLCPERMAELCPDRKVVLLNDREEWNV